jgi:ethanolamine permease
LTFASIKNGSSDMLAQKFKGFVSYRTVHESYLRQRRLTGNANWFLLWGFGVGAVISGDFYGWNYGLAAGGFWGMTIATVLMTIMYICLIYTLAELAATFPHAGGLYSFTRQAFSPFLGFLCGVVVALEYVLATAADIFGMSEYIKPLLPELPNYLVWLVLLTIFCAIAVYSLDLTLYVGLFLTLLAVMVLGIFYVNILAGGIFQPELLFNIPADPGQADWLPKGWSGVFAAMPYGIWFYLAIEILPLASEDTQDASRNIPKALIWGMFSLIILSVLTLVCNTGVGGGAAAIAKSEIPLGDGFEAYFGKGATSLLVTSLTLTLGLGAGVPALIYGYGLILFALSRAGYIPRWLSVTSKNNTPYRAVILGSIVALLCVIVIANGKTVAVDAVILNMSVFGAVMSYILVMFSYIKLKLIRPNLPRPYESPLGIWGAVIGAMLAMVALVACCSVAELRPGIWGIVIVLVIASFYFFFHSRHQLVAEAPEEAAALKGEA